VKSRILRWLLSVTAGVVTFLAVVATLNANGGPRLVERYHSLWGLTHVIAERLDPPGPGDGEFFGPFGSLIDFFLGIAVWTLLFTLAYFLFVFRGPKPI